MDLFHALARLVAQTLDEAAAWATELLADLEARLRRPGGALLTGTATALAAQPIGNVGVTAKYLNITIALIGVLALLTVATRRQRHAAHEPGQTVTT